MIGGISQEDILGFNPRDDWTAEDLDDTVIDPDLVHVNFHNHADIPEHETKAWLKRMGLQKCLDLLDELFPL